MNDQRTTRQRDKLLRLITESPGVSITELSYRTQNLPTAERHRLLSELQAEGKIVPKKLTPNRGMDRTTYWPSQSPPEAHSATPETSRAEVARLLSMALETLHRAVTLLATT